MASTPELRTRLAEAEAAFHALMTGRREVSVAYEGKSVVYTKDNLADLRAYIAELRGHLGTGGRRPLGVSF